MLVTVPLTSSLKPGPEEDVAGVQTLFFKYPPDPGQLFCIGLVMTTLSINHVKDSISHFNLTGAGHWLPSEEARVVKAADLLYQRGVQVAVLIHYVNRTTLIPYSPCGRRVERKSIPR